MKPETLQEIKNYFKDLTIDYYDVNGTPGVVVKQNDALKICKSLKEVFDFDMLCDAVGIDNFQKEYRFEVVYNLYSIKRKDRLFVKVVLLDSTNPKMESITQVWKSANWYEREVYDMLGIEFLNHPDLRRIYMPDEFEYFPLRKDFPTMGIAGSLYLPKK
ncbi:MAG: NADH-quinone oxidoreductase subunit C [Ignavibacteria bacterium]